MQHGPRFQELHQQSKLLVELKDLALTMLRGTVNFGNDGLLLDTHTFSTNRTQ